MWKNREFKVGDEVVDGNFGYGKVDTIKTTYLEVLFLSGERQCYFFDGRIGKPCLFPSLFHTDNIPFELAGKYLKLKEELSKTKTVEDVNATLDKEFKPTETPIEELKVDDVVYRKQGNTPTRIDNLDLRKVWIENPNGSTYWVDKDEFYLYFTTIPPQTTPTPKINRAELLEVASKVVAARLAGNVYFGDDERESMSKAAIKLAKALINEVDKDVENGK
jgi:hypothetical protein